MRERRARREKEIKIESLEWEVDWGGYLTCSWKAGKEMLEGEGMQLSRDLE